MKITKKDLDLVGSAATLPRLVEAIKNKMYWAECKLTLSDKYTSKLGNVYEVENATGRVEGVIVIEARRCSLYRILLNEKANDK